MTFSAAMSALSQGLIVPVGSAMILRSHAVWLESRLHPALFKPSLKQDDRFAARTTALGCA